MVLDEHHVVNGLLQLEGILLPGPGVALIQPGKHRRQPVVPQSAPQRPREAAQSIRRGAGVQPVAAASSVPRRTRRARGRRSCGWHRLEFALLFQRHPTGDFIGGEFGQQVFGDPHQEQLRDALDEEAANPRRHFVGAGFAVVHVEDDDGNDDGEGDEDHGEEDVFAEEGQGEGGGWDDFGNKEKEHGLGEEDINTEGDFLPGVSREVENED